MSALAGAPAMLAQAPGERAAEVQRELERAAREAQAAAQEAARESQALADEATREALRELQAAQGAPGAAQGGAAGEGFQVGPGGEILPADAPVAIDIPPPPDGPPVFPDFPDEIMVMVVVFCLMIVLVSIGTPIARAYARRIDRRGATPDAGGQADQLRQIQNAVETMAIEVERISENQRFVTRLLAEGTGGAAPLAAGRGDALPVDAAREPR